VVRVTGNEISTGLWSEYLKIKGLQDCGHSGWKWNIYSAVVRIYEDEISTGIWSEYLKEGCQLEDLGVNRRI
jgi:hypothetical protein